MSTAPILPRGRHHLSREQVADSQRTRLTTAITELLAEGGYAAVTIGQLAERARVSRRAFYEHFADKEACLLAAYDDFATKLVGAMTAELAEDTPWRAFLELTLLGYLGTLEDDPAAARAFIVEMDSAGPVARRRRRDAVRAFAVLIKQRHTEVRAKDPSLGPLPDRAYEALAFAVRELVHDALEEQREPALRGLAPDILTFITAVIAGASRAPLPAT
jgi:AcrR family transcriptional regulator